MSGGEKVLEVAHDTATYCHLVWRSLNIVTIANGTTVEILRSMGEVYEAVAAREGQLSSVTILLGELKMVVDSKVRLAASELMRSTQGPGIGGAVILPADGLVASFYRSVLAGIQLVGRSTAPNRVFRSFGAGLDWVIDLPRQDPRIVDERAAVRNIVSRRMAAIEQRLSERSDPAKDPP